MSDFLRQLRLGTWTRRYMAFMAMLLPLHFVQPLVRGVSMFNILNLVVVFAVALSPALRVGRLRFLFATPLLVYVFGSILGMVNSEVLFKNVYTLFQDLYLYIWFSIMAMVMAYRREAIPGLVAWWLLSACTMFAITAGFGLGYDGPRMEFSFTNPNRAASYWLVTLFLSFHNSVPKLVRVVVVVVACIAVVMTGSNSGVLGIAVGLAVMMGVRLYARTAGGVSLARVLVVTTLLVSVVVMSESLVAEDALNTIGSTAGGEDNRVDRSTAVRYAIWKVGMETFREHPFGIGPGSFVEQINSEVFGGGNIELHSDFIATLVERGVVGVVGLMWFVLSLLYVLYRSVNALSARSDPATIAWVSSLAGLVVAYLSFAAAHEVLHEDTFWVVMALVSANPASPLFGRA